MSLNLLTHGKRMVGTALLLSLVVLAFGPAFAADDDKLVYGEDDRKDVYEVKDPEQLKWADATCALVSDWMMDFDEQSQTYSMYTYPYRISGDGVTYYEACEGEPFGDQELAAFCSGFLIAPNVVATAGHCISSDYDLMSTYFVFGFEMESATREVTEFGSEQVYRPVSVVTWAYDYTDDGLDYAVFLLDRPIEMTGVEPLSIRSEGKIPDDQPVGTIGHPEGLPKKLVFSDTTRVQDNDHPYYFTANIDYLGGNSGGPVFDAETGLVEGIMVRRGALIPDYVIEGTCWVSNVVDDIDSPAAEVQRTTEFAGDIQEFLSAGIEPNFRAAPARSAQNEPVAVLTWETPLDDEGVVNYQKITIVRTVRDFATSIDEGTTVYTFTATGSTTAANAPEMTLDFNIQEDITYLYTMFVQPREVWYGDVLAFAEATVNDEPITILAEAFGTQRGAGVESIIRPLDVANRQITFSPTTGTDASTPAEGTYSSYGGYTVSTVRGATSLPVARDDGDFDAFQIAMTDDTVITYTFDNLFPYLEREFPFYGKRYDTLHISANGYISFKYASPNSVLNFPFAGDAEFPSLANHFAIPRISYLFSDLNPSAGGEMWIKPMDDRLVITQENVPDSQPMLEDDLSSLNTVQVELFFSGHIRMTYLNVGVPQAIIGLSDGLGEPKRPSEVTSFLTDTMSQIDLSQAPAAPAVLTLAPTAPESVRVGDMADFDVETIAPPTGGLPYLTATWDGPGLAPFADNGDGTGSFTWQTEYGDEGTYLVQVRATLDGVRAYQTVVVQVLPVFVAPEARNLRVYTDTEEPGNVTDDAAAAANRTVSTHDGLLAEYDFYHVLGYPEGETALYWMRNGQVVPGLINQRNVPGGMTRGGDQWNFLVLPVAIEMSQEYLGEYLYGDTAVSPTVLIDGNPQIISVTPNVGRQEGGETVQIAGRDFDGLIGIYFNETQVDFWSYGDTITQNGALYDVLEVTTPLHPPATVDIRIRTNVGELVLENGYTYIGDDEELVIADVNNDTVVDALDIQIVLNAILQTEGLKTTFNPDVNRDGLVNTTDLQLVVNEALVL